MDEGLLMIAINLLRHPLDNERRMQQRFKRDVVGVMCLVLGMVIVCGLVWNDLERSLVRLQDQKNQKMVELVEVKKTFDQFDLMKRQALDLKSKSQQVEALAALQRQPLQLLDGVSRSLDPLNIWLAKLEMKKEQVTLVGFAQTRRQIMQFAQNLKRQKFFQSVAVLETGQKAGESSLYPFSMNLLLTSESNDVAPS